MCRNNEGLYQKPVEKTLFLNFMWVYVRAYMYIWISVENTACLYGAYKENRYRTPSRLTCKVSRAPVLTTFPTRYL